MRLVYSAVLYLSLPFILLRLLWRAFKSPEYLKGWPERFGFVAPQSSEGIIWIHAVSLGETIAAVPMIRALLKEYNNKTLMITNMTPTGSKQVRTSFSQELISGKIKHSYAPYDLPGAVKRFLKRVRPQLLVIMETELWPNVVTLCAKNTIPILLANGRLSQKSANGYKKISWLIQPVFRHITMAAIQNTADATRMQDLGLAADRCEVTGNIKFDLSIDHTTHQRAAELKSILHENRERVIWIAASTHGGEDEIVVETFRAIRQQCPKLLLLLVPRHPERFMDVETLCRNSELTIHRYSAEQKSMADCDVLLGDTVGDLLMFYGVADMAFVGGSMVAIGGHNLIEPAAWGLPILTGPHLFNFSEVSRLLIESGALTVVDSPTALSNKINKLYHDISLRREMGGRARAVVEQNRGALEKLLRLIKTIVAQISRG